VTIPDAPAVPPEVLREFRLRSGIPSEVRFVGPAPGYVALTDDQLRRLLQPVYAAGRDAVHREMDALASELLKNAPPEFDVDVEWEQVVLAYVRHLEAQAGHSEDLARMHRKIDLVVLQLFGRPALNSVGGPREPS
jgi:hypothetical protein